MKNKMIPIFFSCLSAGIVISLLVSCSTTDKNSHTVDLEKEKAALLAAHKEGRTAHFETNAERLVANSVDSFITVSNGNVNYSLPDNRKKFFERYFKNATYTKWDDMQEPIVRISDDGTMAWMITRLEVKRTQTDSTGKEIPGDFVYAGIMTYKKENGVWIKEANVSTFVPATK